MKHPLCAGLVGGALLLSGCQSMNWMSKTKTPSQNSFAQTENVREIPWTWRKKKTPASTAELPADIAQKLDHAKKRSTSPKTAEEWIAEGSEQEVARNFAAAKAAYDAALQVDPGNATAQHRLGILADMRQDFVVAQDHYEAALRQKPHDPNLLSDLGYSHHLRGNVQQSKRYLLQALDIERDHKQALKNLGTLYSSQGWYDDAAMAFRHYRSEAEAQQLLAQYFPNGRPMPGNDISLAGGQRTAPPMPAEGTLDPNTLKGMSPESILQLMERERLAAQRERERKLEAEMRPSLPSSPGGDAFTGSASPRGGQNGPNQALADSAQTPAWTQESPVANTNRGPSASEDPFADRSAFPAEVRTSSSPPADFGRPPSQDLPFWNGAGVQPGSITQNPPSNWPARNASSPANPAAQDAWWAEGHSGATPQGYPPGERTVAAAGSLAPPSGISDYPNVARGGGPSTGDSSAQFRQSSSQNLSRQAYQLGMSAGPGTMFPNVTGPAIGSMAPSTGLGSNSPQWSNSTSPSGYTEMKPSTGWEQPANSLQNSPWQDAPVNTTPQSPTENWNSPSSVPWPGNTSIQPTSGMNSAPRNSNQPLPVITPGRDLGGNSSFGADQNRDSFSRPVAEPGSGSGVVPAWYSSGAGGTQPQESRAGGPSSTATTVPQWPYAPR